MNKKLIPVLIIILLLGFSSSALADVAKQSEVKIDFKGALGMMMKMVGGERPVTMVDYYKGDKHRTDTLGKKGQIISSDIIDLDRELFIHLDHKRNQYTQMTFKEWKEMLDQQMKQAQKTMAENKKQDTEMKWTFDVKVDRTDQTRTIIGYDTEMVTMELAMNAVATNKSSENEETGPPAEMEMKVLSSLWMAKNVDGMKEINKFNSKFAKKFGQHFGQGGPAQMMQGLSQNNPQLAEAMKEMERESKKMKGLALRNHSVFSGMGSSAKKQQSGGMGAMGNIFGGIKNSFGKKSKQSQDENVQSAEKILMETTSTVMSISTEKIDSQKFEIPSGYLLQTSN